jgi:hypothetical protein
LRSSCRFLTVLRKAAIRVLAAAICPLASLINVSHVVNTFVLTDFQVCVNLSFVPNYNVMLGELQEDFKRAMAEREQLDRRIAGLMKAMEAVKALAEDAAEPIIQPPPLADEAGFTDKVRNLLRANPARLFSAVEIRDVFLEFDPKADPKILLIHTHNTVKRLHRQKEVEEVTGSDGKTSYRWQTPGINVGDSVMAILAGLTTIPYGRTVPPPPGSDEKDEKVKLPLTAGEAKRMMQEHLRKK